MSPVSFKNPLQFIDIVGCFIAGMSLIFRKADVNLLPMRSTSAPACRNGKKMWVKYVDLQNEACRLNPVVCTFFEKGYSRK